MTGPDPDTLYPLAGFDRVAFLRPLAAGRSNVEVGAYSYYDDPEDPTAFFEKNVLYHYDFMGDRLLIGRFVALAAGVRILMNGGTHALAGFSTYPFNIFGHGWERGFDPASLAPGFRGDTRIGHDVWIGTEAVILPGVSIGSGAIVAARAVVSRVVPPYALVAGNPARVMRRRFDEATIAALLEIAWWDWPVDRITRHLDAIRGADIAALQAAP